jgi:hypothetical protein
MTPEDLVASFARGLVQALLAAESKESARVKKKPGSNSTPKDKVQAGGQVPLPFLPRPEFAEPENPNEPAPTVADLEAFFAKGAPSRQFPDEPSEVKSWLSPPV